MYGFIYIGDVVCKQNYKLLKNKNEKKIFTMINMCKIEKQILI